MRSKIEVLDNDLIGLGNVSGCWWKDMNERKAVEVLQTL